MGLGKDAEKLLEIFTGVVVDDVRAVIIMFETAPEGYPDLLDCVLEALDTRLGGLLTVPDFALVDCAKKKHTIKFRFSYN